ncbi:MAG TPA: TRASH domain-containing protein [Methylomirabilota bacterium]|nr:TRASH domain-containing protein [Methylomirabilota bacterium]
MKTLFAVLFAAALVPAFAADAKKDEKAPKPYKLDTCAVSDEKLGDMGDPYVFTHEGQEYKLCCKSCKKDFDKNPKKFAKKLEKAEKGDKKK